MPNNDSQIIVGTNPEQESQIESLNNLPMKAPEHFEIISTNDERLKIIGKELADDTGRAIFTIICQRGLMSSTDVAKMLDISLPLVNWHIHRLLNSGLIKIDKLAMSQKNKPVKYYAPTSTIIIIGTELGEQGQGNTSTTDSDGNDKYSSLTRKRLATRAIWSRLTRSVSAALVSFVAATSVIFALGRILTGPTSENSNLAGNGIKLADPDAIVAPPQAPPIDSLPAFLYSSMPSILAVIVMALLGGAVVGATVIIVMKIAKLRTRD